MTSCTNGYVQTKATSNWRGRTDVRSQGRCRARALRAHFAADTGHARLPRSSATSRAPSRAIATPSKRPHASLRIQEPGQHVKTGLTAFQLDLADPDPPYLGRALASACDQRGLPAGNRAMEPLLPHLAAHAVRLDDPYRPNARSAVPGAWRRMAVGRTSGNLSQRALSNVASRIHRSRGRCPRVCATAANAQRTVRGFGWPIAAWGPQNPWLKRSSFRVSYSSVIIRGFVDGTPP